MDGDVSNQPEIDWLQWLQINQGTKIERRHGLGRVVIATEAVDFEEILQSSSQLGFKIIRERPALLFGKSYNSVLEAFHSASDDVQRAVLDMYHPPLDNENQLRLCAESIAPMISMDVHTSHKVLSISDTNAHEYRGASANVGYTSYEGSTSELMNGRMSCNAAALFVYASKVAHSCLPNVTYTSNTIDGCMEYKVIRPIQAGEMITFTYIDKLFESSTKERRDELFRTKSFVCHCKRCDGPDYARSVICPLPDCNKQIFCSNAISRDHADDVWTCHACGPIDELKLQAFFEAERATKLQLEQMKLTAAMGMANISIPSFERLLTTVLPSKLAKTHHLVIQAWEHFSTKCASAAATIGNIPLFMQRPNCPSASSLSWKAAQAGLQMASLSECVAHECPGSCTEAHPPVYEYTRYVFHACQDVFNVPSIQWTVGTVAMIKRYMPYFRVWLNSDDSDVIQIEAKLANVPPLDNKTVLRQKFSYGCSEFQKAKPPVVSMNQPLAQARKGKHKPGKKKKKRR